VTAALPLAVQSHFHRFVTCELTTIDARGLPVTWPVMPFYTPGDPYISVSTGLGWPKKARDARRNPKVALLFSDPTGSDIAQPSMVLVQGVAEVDDRDLDGNRERYLRESAAKLGRRSGAAAPGARFDWYFTRIYIHVRPERVHIWRGGDCEVEPELIELPAAEDAEAGGSEPGGGEPRAGDEKASGGSTRDAGSTRARSMRRVHELGGRFETAVLSVVAHDGYPFSIRVPVSTERRGGRIRIDATPAATLPLLPGPACVTAHDHDEKLAWSRNFQVRGQLLGDRSGWLVTPQEVVDGFELPPVGPLTRAIGNFKKIRRFRQTAKRERVRRSSGAAGGSESAGSS
jgi:hypothetical protein